MSNKKSYMNKKNLISEGFFDNLLNNCILGENSDCSCGDLNLDNIVNVLDVVLLVNIILES